MYLGLDPGLTGSIVALDHSGQWLWADDLPVSVMQPEGEKAIRRLDTRKLERVIRALTPMPNAPQASVRLVVVERVMGMRQDAASFAFSFGETVGVIRSVLEMLRLHYVLVPPSVWQAHFGLANGKDRKSRSLAKARALFPGSGARLTLAKHHNRAEAALLARYGYERSQAGTRHTDFSVRGVVPGL